MAQFLSSSVRSGFALAGKVTGIAQGCLSSLAVRAQQTAQAKPQEVAGPRQLPEQQKAVAVGQLRTPHGQPSKALLNVVVVGDCGAGQAAAVGAYVGRSLTLGHSELELANTTVAGQPVTLAIWCIGGPEDSTRLGSDFFGLASCCLIVYDPAQQQSPVESLERWSHVCCCCSSGGSVAKAVVVACCQAASAVQEWDGSLESGRQWCAAHGGIPHIIMHGIDDVPAAKLAFSEAARLALGHAHQRQQAQVPQNRTGATESDRAVDRSCALQLKLPLLMQSELGPALEVLSSRRP